MSSIFVTPASLITRAASKQTYYTIQFLVDRGRSEDAYRAYAYFRWVDDILDADGGLKQAHNETETSGRTAFLERQKRLLDQCYQGRYPQQVNAHEKMLVDLVRRNPEHGSGLQAYLKNMMWVMDFDARRRGRLIAQAELTEYTRHLATAVTEAMHYFIGHDEDAPRDDTRYLAVTAAHITHMLRDMRDDVQAGYFNIPLEILEANGIGPQEFDSSVYRAWVHSRVLLAREYFNEGKKYLARVQNFRCRLAGLAYTERFTGVLDAIEQEGYILRAAYPERKGAKAILRTGASLLASAFLHLNLQPSHIPLNIHQQSPRGT